MSGGHFDYAQHRITDIIDTLKDEVNPDQKGRHEWHKLAHEYMHPETIERMKLGIKLLEDAYKFAHEADWLLSADTGEDTFLKKTEFLRR